MWFVSWYCCVLFVVVCLCVIFICHVLRFDIVFVLVVLFVALFLVCPFLICLLFLVCFFVAFLDVFVLLRWCLCCCCSSFFVFVFGSCGLSWIGSRTAALTFVYPLLMCCVLSVVSCLRLLFVCHVLCFGIVFVLYFPCAFVSCFVYVLFLLCVLFDVCFCLCNCVHVRVFVLCMFDLFFSCS